MIAITNLLKNDVSKSLECLLYEMLFIYWFKQTIGLDTLKTIYLTFYISIIVCLVLFYCSLFNLHV